MQIRRNICFIPTLLLIQMIKHIAADILKDPNFVSEFVQNLSPPSLVVSSSTPTAVQFSTPFVDALVPAPFNPVPDLPPSCPVVSALISTPFFLQIRVLTELFLQQQIFSGVLLLPGNFLEQKCSYWVRWGQREKY